MALQRTAVFKCGAFHHECSRDDIAKAFFDTFSDRHSVVSIQIVPNNVVKVCFGSAESKKAVCAVQSHVIDDVECTVLNYAQRTTLVQVHHYPAEANDKDLQDVLKDFGEIVEFRHQHWVGLTDVTTGTRLVSMKLTRDIPRLLKLDKSRLKVWYKGQPLECDICSKDHKASECDLRGKCRLCRQSGHFARNCPNPWGSAAPPQDPDPEPSAASASGPAPGPAPAPAPASSPSSASVSALSPLAPSSVPVPLMEVDGSAISDDDSAFSWAFLLNVIVLLM